MENSLYKRRGIYGIKNKINNKIYVGKTQINFGDRRDSHYALLRNNKHFNSYLQNAYNKYGNNNFEFIILEDCHEEDSLEFYNELECKYIKYYKDLNLSYNFSDGGDGAKGIPCSEEQKRKIGEKNRINMTGRKATEETKKKMSESQKKRKHTPESIEKMKRIHKGKIISLETREKISKTLQENPTQQKYDKETILSIRTDKEINNLSNDEIYEKYNFISERYIRMILNYERWKNIKPIIN